MITVDIKFSSLDIRLNVVLLCTQAMMDVDETYLNPHKKYREQTKKRNSRKHVQKKKEQVQNVYCLF